MRKITDFFKNDEILQSINLFSVLSFFTVAVILTLMFSMRYYLYQNLIVNEIAQKTIVAKNNFEVIDKQKTELIKRELANKIRPIVIPIENEYILTDLQKVMDNIEQIKKERKTYKQKEKELSDLLDISDIERKKLAINYILTNSEANLSSAFTNVKYILNEVLNAGIYDTDITNFVDDNYIAKILSHHAKKSQNPLIIGLLEHCIIPNLIIDEYATEIAKKNVRNAVKPSIVSFKKGEAIVKAGDRVTQLKKDALKQSGYNAFELNKGGVIGIFLLVSIIMYSLVLYIRKYEKKFYTPRYMSYIAISSIILTAVSIAISNSNIISNYLMPFIAFSTILAIFTNPILSFLVSILMLAILSAVLFLDSQTIYTYICVILSSSYLVSKISYARRFDIILCGAQVGLVMFLAMFSISLFENQFDAFKELLHLQVQNPFIGILNGLVCAMMAIFLIPIIEKLFKLVSPYALIELADQNQELLSKMRSSAPGTFHHSLMVANLCEAAASAIGADAILARVGAFYHDLGKLQRPYFFIENQSYFGVENPHTNLTPRQSKMVITQHTKDGVEIAKKNGLPQVIIDFIQQHHGESLAGYFYNKAIEQEGEENVQEGQFRYPGPKPKTKETAILMLADALESAVRSLKNPSAEEIETMVNKIFTERLNDGQLSDSPLTLKDIKIIALTFNKVLRGMQHERIKYQNKVIDELDKNKIISQNAGDEEFERKIQELQSKSQTKDNKNGFEK